MPCDACIGHVPWRGTMFLETESNRRSNNYQHKYCPRYCEENVWHLCQEPYFASLDSKVVVISNERRACAFWHQRAAHGIGVPTIWDYHVVVLVYANHWCVWDLDSTLGLPVSAREYFSETFRDLPPGFTMFSPCFRIMKAADYVERFSSDRSHMRDRDGGWLAPPPPWPLILNGELPSLPSMFDFRPERRPEPITLKQMYCLVK